MTRRLRVAVAHRAGPDTIGPPYAESMVTQRQITIETADGPMPAHEARPDATPKGTVVVVQEAFGLTSHIEDVTRRLAAVGYRAVAPALFHRQGSPVMAYDDYDKVLPVMADLTAEGLRTDMLATIDSLDTAPSGIGVIGFCMGGAVTLFAGTLRPLGAAVTFYGGGVATGRFGLPPLIELAASLQTPWLGLYGDQDQGIPVEDVERLREAAETSPVPTEIVRYPEGQHGFHCDDRPAVFDAAAAADAWRRTLEWLDGHLAA